MTASKLLIPTHCTHTEIFLKEAEIIFTEVNITFNVWQSQDQPVETQQNNRQELQITLQEMIDMINSFTAEEIIVFNVIQEEMMIFNII